LTAQGGVKGFFERLTAHFLGPPLYGGSKFGSRTDADAARHSAFSYLAMLGTSSHGG